MDIIRTTTEWCSAICYFRNKSKFAIKRITKFTGTLYLLVKRTIMYSENYLLQTIKNIQPDNLINFEILYLWMLGINAMNVSYERYALIKSTHSMHKNQNFNCIYLFKMRNSRKYPDKSCWYFCQYLWA